MVSISSGSLQREVVIVGGGPAGLSTALALWARGVDCTVIDARRPPVDKACGEGLMPDALSSLKQLGIVLPPDLGVPFKGIRFLDEQNQVEASFPQGMGRGVRRTELQQLLAEHAEKAGVEMFWGHTASYVSERRITLHDRHGGAREIQTKWLVGADGQSSAIRCRSGLNKLLKLQTRYGFRQHYKIAPWADFVEVYWGRCGQIFVTPVGPEEVGLALCSKNPRLRVNEALQQFPALQKRLAGVPVVSRERGALTTMRRLEQVSRGSVALVGDASGSVDAVTGEGIAVLLRQAMALAGAIEAGDLPSYNAAHAEICRIPAIMASMLLTLDRHPDLRKRLLCVLAGAPQSFARMLSVHVGHAPIWQVALSEAPKLGWRWLTA